MLPMSDQKVTVVALIKAQEGKEELVRNELQGLIPTTLDEPGCINYDLHESADRPGLFMFHENWETKKHLEDHLARPHLQAFLAKSEELVADPVQVTLWKAV